MVKARSVQQLTEMERNLKRHLRRWNWTGARDEFFEMVKRRIGENPEDRLAWVLRLVAQDLSTLQKGEHVRLGDDLQVCAFLALRDVGGYRIKTDDMTRAEFEGYLKAIDSGVRGLLQTKPEPWAFTATPEVVAKDGRFFIHFMADEAGGILGGIGHLVVEVGDRLRACRDCGKPFVAKARQARYCSSQCSDRRWNRERTTKEGSNG